MKNRIRLIGNIVMVMTLAFMFMACPDGPDPDPNPNPLGGQVSQPPIDPVLAGEFGVYTSGTNLVIKSGTQVYAYPVSGDGAVADLSPYSGSAQVIKIRINDNEVQTITLPANGILGTTAVAAPSDSLLLTGSDLFEYSFHVTLPLDSFTEEVAGTLVGQLLSPPLNLCSPDAIFQDYEMINGEYYYFFYSNGNGTMRLPLTQVSPGRFIEANMQFKTGWNCVAYSTSGNTTTMVSKNPPSNARWEYYN